MTDDEPDFEVPDFEEFRAFANMGKMGLSIYRAVIRDGGSENEAFSVTAAFFAGMTKGMQSDDPDED